VRQLRAAAGLTQEELAQAAGLPVGTLSDLERGVTRTATFIPSLQAQLRAALAVFYALDGPTLETADDLAAKAYSLTTQPIEILHLATNSLGELKRLTDQEEKLRLT